MIDQDELEQMVSYRGNITGIAHTIFISPRGNIRHGPRVKVAINPRDSVAPRGIIATVTFEGKAIGPIDPQLLRQVRRFIELNRDVLLDYWNEKIYTDELQARIIPLDL